jgi:hypothetical protein
MCQPGAFKWMGYGDLRKGILTSPNGVLHPFGSEEPELHILPLVSEEISPVGGAK